MITFDDDTTPETLKPIVLHSGQGQLPVEMIDEEKIAMAKSFAEAYAEAEKYDVECADAKRAMAETSKEKWALVSEYARTVKSGKVLRAVDVQDQLIAKEVVTVRMDTNEVLGRRPATVHELNAELPFEGSN